MATFSAISNINQYYLLKYLSFYWHEFYPHGSADIIIIATKADSTYLGK